MSMQHSARVGLLAAVAAVLASCGTAATAEVPPATVTHIAGSQVSRLQLTDQAIHRLGITTQPVREVPAAAGKSSARAGTRTVIPYSAVVYDTNGSTWTYVNTAARTYVRQPIKITAIRGHTAVLSGGPAAGAAVVTAGAPELLGTEFDISGEE